MSASIGGDFHHEPVLEGFLCPICKTDLKTPDLLTAHVENEHSEPADQDLIRSFRGMLLTAKKKIRNEFASTAAAAAGDSGKTSPGSSASSTSSSSAAVAAAAAVHTSAYPPLFADPPQPQTIGADMDHTAHFKAIRSPRLERYATDTNKLLIRLHKLLDHRPADRGQRKQHEQLTVPWVEGKLVPGCPGCAKRFLLTRRQHHCRLCGSVMCNDCSRFLDLEEAVGLVNTGRQEPFYLGQKNVGHADAEQSAAKPEDTTLRVCEHCLHLLGTRQDMQDSRTFRPPICELYARIERLKTAVEPDCTSYGKVVASLMGGDTVFTLADAGALRARIGHTAEQIDALSKAVLQLQQGGPKGGQAERLQRFVRLACVQYIKEQMLELEPLPAAAEVEALQKRRRQETEQRIERERRLALEQWERRAAAAAKEEAAAAAGEDGRGTGAIGRRSGNESSVSGSNFTSLDNWSAGQARPHHHHRAAGQVDVLVEQINNIKGFIKQARDALRFEEVEILELNLRELQNEFYERQQQAQAD